MPSGKPARPTGGRRGLSNGVEQAAQGTGSPDQLRRQTLPGSPRWRQAGAGYPSKGAGGPRGGDQMTDAGPKVSLAAAARILADRDPVIARLLADTGPPRRRPPTESPFAALVRA